MAQDPCACTQGPRAVPAPRGRNGACNPRSMALVIGPSPFFLSYQAIPRGVPASVAVDRIAASLSGAVDLHGHAAGAGLAHLFVRRHPRLVRRLALSRFGLYTRAHLLRARLRAIVDEDAAVLVDLFAWEREYGMRDPVFMPGRVLLLLDDETTQLEREHLVATYPGARLTWDPFDVAAFLSDATAVVSAGEPR